METLRLTHGGDVYDPDARTVAKQALEGEVLLALIDGALHLEAQIRSREAGDGDDRIIHPELSRDVATNLVRRRRGERENGRPAEPFHDGAKHEVVGPKIVAPLTHAMRFVDDEEA